MIHWDKREKKSRESRVVGERKRERKRERQRLSDKETAERQ